VNSVQLHYTIEEIGRKVINDLLTRPDFMIYVTDFWTGVHYAEACAGFGAARLAGLLKDSQIINRLSDRYSKVIADNLVKDADHVDANVYGILPLELYLQTREEKYLHQGIVLADGQWNKTLPGKLTNQIRYWVDDIWMIASLQVQAYRVTGKDFYLERGAMVADSYLHTLQEPNGLFYHGENAPFFWGRGNGWAAAGLAELLSELPVASPYYPSISEGYKKMMDTLCTYQAEDGMWRQLIDKEESWKETSATAMIGYAVTVGVKKGILAETLFTPVYEKAWRSLLYYINDDGKLSMICGGTEKGDTIEYYLNRPRNTGDLHAQAAVLWFAYSLLAAY
jgi:unsaturated rhamnogalacturonyl hydrolase